ncbi:hypothetical protein CCHR01_04168 [Colletotrichum chrysophilum]|uniref:Uncharacterized protein n=1 Tax=Colletotrichum chrysophilum TaxID=1836956 RepID=A0AAD9ARF4_9PEZI|nr:hypothetical protein CCHR01_04168 [Colletotrichum chrysophilum]
MQASYRPKCSANQSDTNIDITSGATRPTDQTLLHLSRAARCHKTWARWLIGTTLRKKVNRRQSLERFGAKPPAALCVPSTIGAIVQFQQNVSTGA